MIDWLQKFGGYTSTGLTIDEKKELESLRLQVKKYRSMEEAKKEEIKEETKDDDKSQSQSDSEEDDIDPELDNIVNKINSNPQMKKMSLLPRSGVSAEVYGMFHKKENFVARVIKKTPEQIQRIKSSVIHSFLFGNLEPKDLEVVINAMEEKRYKKGQNIITQGDNGDCLYFVEEGNLNCFKKFQGQDEPKLVKKYQPGDAFGELALLYNAPRAATITHLPPHRHQRGIPLRTGVQVVFRSSRRLAVHRLAAGEQRTVVIADGCGGILLFLGHQGDETATGARAQGLVPPQPQAHLSVGREGSEIIR